MIDHIRQGVEEKLLRQKYPISTVYGPELAPRQYFAHGLFLFERDRSASDAWAPVQGAQVNPDVRGMRRIGGRVEIHAQSSVEGARVQDHENECDDFVDAFLIALAEWCVENKRGRDPYTIVECRFLRAEEIRARALAANDYTAADAPPAVEVWAGAIYLVRFNVPRVAAKVDYAGGIKPTGTPAGVANRTDVRLEKHEGPATTGCDSISRLP